MAVNTTTRARRLRHIRGLGFGNGSRYSVRVPDSGLRPRTAVVSLWKHPHRIPHRPCCVCRISRPAACRDGSAPPSHRGLRFRFRLCAHHRYACGSYQRTYDHTGCRLHSAHSETNRHHAADVALCPAADDCGSVHLPTAADDAACRHHQRCRLNSRTDGCLRHQHSCLGNHRADPHRHLCRRTAVETGKTKHSYIKHCQENL